MSKRSSISAYTPSNTDPEILKRIFVQREKLLERIVDRLARSITTRDKHHILLVGPRGSGKTHLVSLATWELGKRQELQAKMRIAWLGEDDSFTGLVHFAFGIARRLAEEYPDEFSSDFKSAVRGLAPDDAALAVLTKIVEGLGDRSLILVTENMDQTFRGLGDTGQKKWRAFLQENRKIATLATSQQLFAGVSDRTEAFFGFFDIQHLEPLSVEGASELIGRISIEQEKPELHAYLNTAEGRYRIRALHYLAGGNHRMYVLLAEFLTKDSLDDLVEAFEELAHDMTPYFQERMRSLPDQQRQLAQCLCDAESALTVKQVAAESFIEERTCSKQLGNLKAKGYVRSEKRGKESYYDMAEPLMRLCLDVKNQRGRPLKLVARFLKAWFPASKLQRINDGNESTSRADEYRNEAANCGAYFKQAIASDLAASITRSIRVGRVEEAKSFIDELKYADPTLALIKETHLAQNQGDAPLQISKLTEILESESSTSDLKARALVNRGITFSQQNDTESAIADYSAVVEMNDAPAGLKATTLFNRGVTFSQQNDMESATADYSAVVEMNDAPAGLKAMALFNRGVTFSQQNDMESAIADYSAVVEMSYAPADLKAEALFNRGIAFSQQNETEKEIADYSAVIEMSDAPADHKAKALVSRGFRFSQQNKTEKAIADFNAVIDMSDAPADHKAKALVSRGVRFSQQNETEKEIADYSAVIEMNDAPADQKARALVNRGVRFGQQNEPEKAIVDYSAVIDMSDAPADQKAKALFNRGVTFSHRNETEKEIADYSDVIDMSDAPADLNAEALFYRGVRFSQRNEPEKAIADYSDVIDMSDAPADQKSKALVYRGITFSQQNETEKEIADYSAVIEMNDAPADQKAKALFSRGVANWRTDKFEESCNDFTSVLEISALSSEQATKTLFALPESMVAFRPRSEVIEALTRAFAEGDRETEEYGGTPDDLLWMVLRGSPSEWENYAKQITALHAKFDTAEKLGQGITQTIRHLDEGEYSAAQIDKWNSIWQEAGMDCEGLELPLRCLKLAAEVIKSEPKTDRPLFQLPLEIRRLVRTLLNKSLGEPDPAK